MITETPERGRFWSALRGGIFGGPEGWREGWDARSRYEIPEDVDAELKLPGGADIVINGPRENVQLKYRTNESGVGFDVNKLAPQGTTFTVWSRSRTPFDRVRTNIDKKRIMIPVGRAHREALPLSILHGIARLKLHEDKDYDTQSRAAHALLQGQLAALADWGLLPEKPTLDEEIHGWKQVCAEERAVSESALLMLKQILEAGVNPLPGVTDYCLLADLVNSNHLLRTARQELIDPKWTGRNLGYAMTLKDSRVRELMDPYFRS